MRSEYLFGRGRWSAGEDNPHLMNLNLPLDEWVMATYHHDAYRTRSFFQRTGVPYNQRNLVGDVAIWFISQVAWLSDANNLLIVDDLLRFEHLTEDWSAFSAKHGIERELVHVNSSARQAGAEQHMTQRTRDIISEYYREDFERFGYER